MANGYIRQEAGSFVTGGTMTAAIFNNEYNAIVSAFNATTGHNHDGTAGGGAQIPTGGIENLAVTTGKLAASAVTYAKIQNVSATDKILGRVSASAGVVEEITFTDAAQALCDDTDASAMRATLGVVIGLDVQAYDATLTALAAVSTAADKVIYATGSDTFSTADLTSFGRTLIANASASDARTDLGLVIGTDVLAYDADVVYKDIVTNFTKQQYFGEATLTDGTNISWDLDTAQSAKVTLEGNRTLSNPTNMKAGATYILRVIQDGTGGRTLAYGNAYQWPSGITPTLSTGIGAIDLLSFYCDGTDMYGTIIKSY
jgi:hypothetical protein